MTTFFDLETDYKNNIKKPVKGLYSNIYKCKPDCCRVDNALLQLSSKSSAKPEFVPIGKIKEIPDSVKYSVTKNISSFYFKHISKQYKSVENKGINYKGARKTDICLAKYSLAVANQIDTVGACYTGVKYSLLSAGVINDYGDMPKGSASDSLQYFEKNKEKFQEIKVERNDLSKLPAGMIIVYSKKGEDGHIAITNGKGQEMSDCTDNMKWLEKQGDGASYKVFKLTDNWEYNEHTKKLEFDKK